MGILRQGLHAQQLQSQTVYAIEDAEEVRLVDDLSDEDRLPVFSLHLHPFEGSRVPLTELASHHYAVDHPCTPTDHLTIRLAASYTPIRRSYKHVRRGPMPNFGELRHCEVRGNGKR